MDAFLQRVWYEGRSQWFSLLLLPLSWLFGAIAAVRRIAWVVLLNVAIGEADMHVIDHLLDRTLSAQ